MRAIPAIEKITHQELLRIQNETVDARFADDGYRHDQVYVAEQLDREARRALENIVDLPDREANLFIKLCLRNGGKLSVGKRKSHFTSLTDKEIRSMEHAVSTHMGRLMRKLS